MPAATGLTIIKNFSYRGVSEQWSNQYWFTMAPPSTTAAWDTLFDALVLQEKTVYPNLVTVVKGYGYNVDTDNAAAVYVRDITAAPVAGTCVQSLGAAEAGDTAVWVRWHTGRYTIKGKAIYLRKYFHPAIGVTASPDLVTTAQKDALNALGVKLRDGSFAGGRTVTARGHADAPISSSASQYVTTRTLKRRGKRPGA